MDLSLLTLKRLIVHELPMLGPGQRTPGTISNAQSPFPQRIRHFFEQRIRSALNDYGLKIRFRDPPESPVPAELTKILQGPSQFVPASANIASHLFGVHNGTHSSGLLCISSGVLDGKDAVAVIKLEHESGVRAQRQETNGQLLFEIIVVDDLMLTDNTRVFKVALFVNDGDGLYALACDTQRSRSQLLAGYFLGAFLGCELADRPDVLTKRFLDVAERFLNEKIGEPQARAAAQVGLLAELGNVSNSFSPRHFSTQHIPADLRPEFLNVLRNEGISAQTINKDLALVRSRILRVHFEIDGGLSVLAPPNTVGNQVRVSGLSNGQSKIEVMGRLKSVEGHR